MRLLVGCLLMLIALVYFQSERHDCSIGMSVENWFLCVTREIDQPWRDLLPLPTDLTATNAYVRFVSLADIGQPIRDVRFAPESGHVQRRKAQLARTGDP